MRKIKKVFLFALMIVMMTLVNRVVSAQNFVFETGTSTTGSQNFGFDPTTNLISAVTNTDASAGPCFTCANTGAAGGTTAGALTNSMFGDIRLNSEADLGEKSFMPPQQGMVIPTARSVPRQQALQGVTIQGHLLLVPPFRLKTF